MKPFTKEHCKAISDGLKKYYRDQSYTRTKGGPKMQLKQKKAILLSMLRKRDKEGTSPKLEHELTKIGSDIHKLNNKIKHGKK